MKDKEKTREQLIKELRQIRGRVRDLEAANAKADLKQLMRTVESLADMGVNAEDNIARLASLVGELLGADLTLYHRTGRGTLSWPGKRFPTGPDAPCAEPDGEIAFDLVKESGNETVIIHDLQGSEYATSDPGIASGGFHTYTGVAVKFGHSLYGALSLYHTKHFEPSESEKSVIRSIPAAIAREEKRREAEEALVYGEQLRGKILAASPLAISYSEGGSIKWTNKAMIDIFGEDLEENYGGRTPGEFYYSDEEYQRVRALFYKNLEEGKLTQADAKFKRRDGSFFHGHIAISAIDPSNPRKGTIAAISDISERKEAEEALRMSEDKYKKLYEESFRREELWRSLLNSCADAIVIYDMQGRAQYVSDSFTEIFGWTREEVLGSQIPYVPPPEREATMAHIDELLSGGVARSGFETRRYTKDGRVLDTAISASRYNDHEGNPAGMLVILSDISERKRAAKALALSEQQLRMLSAQLLTAQENERKRVAQELHDGIGQSLTAIKFRLETSLQQSTGAEASQRDESLAAIIPLIQNAIDEVRRICIDLRPSILDDLGVLATLGWFCREFQATYSGIRILREIDLLEEDVPEPLKIVIFRIVQEAMNNVVKHSTADKVRLRLTKSDGALDLEIEDNGPGFDLSEAFSSDSATKGFGLASMKERTDFSGGSFAVQAGAGSGTAIRVSWPDDAPLPMFR